MTVDGGRGQVFESVFDFNKLSKYSETIFCRYGL